MNKFINKLLLLAGLLLAQASIAQIKVTGVVTDEQKSPLPSVSVVVKGTTHGVATDFDGNYSIEVPNNAVLEFSSIGYQTLTKKVTTVNGGVNRW
jgi:tonB-dependent receptor plug